MKRRKKSSKFGYVLLLMVLLGILAFLTQSLGVFKKDEEESVNSIYTITVSEDYVTELGSRVGNTTFEAKDGKTEMHFVGDGKGVIQPCAGASLEFVDLTIVDSTSDVWTDLYGTYLRFGGEIKFTNCVFKNSIYLLNNANMTFENCVFESGMTKHYSVWVADGSASFINCTFKGYRGLKINEFDDFYKVQVGEQEDVETVIVSGCTFDNISEKPGVCLGSFATNLENTSVSLVGNIFYGCEIYEDDDAFGIQFIEDDNQVIYEEDL